MAAAGIPDELMRAMALPHPVHRAGSDTDGRARKAACLVGVSCVQDLGHIGRGYEDIARDLTTLGESAARTETAGHIT